MEKQKKQKMDEITKVKLIYSGELALFSIVFVVLGILILVKVIPMSERRELIFTWITLFGGFITLGDFFWMLFSKKRQKKGSLLDKILVLPVSLSLIPLDIIALITKPADQYYVLTMGIVFCYIALIYVFEAIYHYYRPIPSLLEDEEKDQKKEDAIDNEESSKIEGQDDKSPKE